MECKALILEHLQTNFWSSYVDAKRLTRIATQDKDYASQVKKQAAEERKQQYFGGLCNQQLRVRGFGGCPGGSLHALDQRQTEGYTTQGKQAVQGPGKWTRSHCPARAAVWEESYWKVRS